MTEISILEQIPHRYPFLLVDKVVSVEPGKSIHAIKNVSFNEPHFEGHFPFAPVMPGVLIVEALAQASGILIFETLERNIDFAKDFFVLTGVDKAKFKKMVVPGDHLHLHAEVLRARDPLWKFTCEARVDGELACQAEIKTMKGRHDD